MILTGQNLQGRYIIQERIGRGGFGDVYKAVDRLHDRIVAVKVIRLVDSETSQVFSLLDEARQLAKTSHPNIMPVENFGETEDDAYLVMPFADGGTLHNKLLKWGSLPIKLVAEFLDQLASGLDYAHNQNVLHRDLKPLNILLFKQQSNENELEMYWNWQLKISDFGLAKALSRNTIYTSTRTNGTPTYMAPEQFNGKASRTSDIYSLGITVYQLLTGLPPFTGTQFEVMYAHLNKPLPNLLDKRPDAPDGLQEVLEIATDKDFRKRYKSALEFADAFKETVENYPNSGANPWVTGLFKSDLISSELPAEQNLTHFTSLDLDFGNNNSISRALDLLASSEIEDSAWATPNLASLPDSKINSSPLQSSGTSLSLAGSATNKSMPGEFTEEFFTAPFQSSAQLTQSVTEARLETIQTNHKPALQGESTLQFNNPGAQTVPLGYKAAFPSGEATQPLRQADINELTTSGVTTLPALNVVTAQKVTPETTAPKPKNQKLIFAVSSIGVVLVLAVIISIIFSNQTNTSTTLPATATTLPATSIAAASPASNPSLAVTQVIKPSPGETTLPVTKNPTATSVVPTATVLENTISSSGAVTTILAETPTVPVQVSTTQAPTTVNLTVAPTNSNQRVQATKTSKPTTNIVVSKPTAVPPTATQQPQPTVVLPTSTLESAIPTVTVGPPSFTPVPVVPTSTPENTATVRPTSAPASNPGQPKPAQTSPATKPNTPVPSTPPVTTAIPPTQTTPPVSTTASPTPKPPTPTPRPPTPTPKPTPSS